MKRLEISVLLAVVFCAAVSFFSFEEQCSAIRDSVLRMHILAASDSESDQRLKLAVRDRLLEVSEDVFSGCASYDEALTAAQENIPLFLHEAESVLRENGCGDAVSVSVEKSYFTTRTYGSITLPAGVYDALQVRIGEARGHNWWCVMFPTVCLPSAAGEEQLGRVLDDGQVTIVSGNGYELRFRCVELYEQFLEQLRRAAD